MLLVKIEDSFLMRVCKKQYWKELLYLFRLINENDQFDLNEKESKWIGDITECII